MLLFFYLEDILKISEKIKKAILDHPYDIVPYRDLVSYIVSSESEERENVKWLLDETAKMMRLAPINQVELFYTEWRRGLLIASRFDFDSFLQYVELDRDRDKKFYLPRRRYLKRIVDHYQMVADGELDLLTISMPKRSGKSQTGINFVNFLSGRQPDRSTLMEGTGDDLVKSFYNGCLEYLQLPTEYRFYDVFPEAKLVQTSADSKIINLHKRSRFPTIMCRSIDSRQVGLSEATNLLYMDDCVEGREEAKNRQRLDDKWEVISGDIMGRAIEGTPMVFCGTRYSIYDPIGRVQEFAKTQNWRWKALEIPALDENDESNYEFEKDGVKIFTSDYFKQQRDLLSSEQWESEFQQQPFEAKGLLFNKDELNYFYELPPDKDPDSIIAVADTAEKGSDSTAMPIAYLYGDDVYIVDVVFDNSAPEHTKPECANMLMKYKVVTATFESNSAGEYFARDVNELCLRNGFRTNIRTKRTISNKMTRMEMASDGIKKNFFFRHPSTVKRGSQYYEFMKEVTTITRTGKVAHDDAPDSLSLLENEIRNLNRGKVEILERLF